MKDAIQETIIEEFAIFDEWLDKYDYLIELSQTLPAIAPEHRTEEYVIKGCQSRVWVDAKVDEGALARTEAIILSMTPKERVNPDIINSSRKKRIAMGSGTSVEEINKLLKQFEQMKKMMKQMASGKMGGLFGGFGKRKMPFKF